MKQKKLARSANAKRNIIFGMMNKIVVLFLPFIMRLVVIRILGSEYLGLSSLFSSILQVLNMTELGFSSAVIYVMYTPIAEDDMKTLGKILNFYRKVYKTIGTLILLVGIMILPFLPNFIKGGYPETINIYVLYSIYLANTVVSYWLFAYKSSLLSAYQRSDILININTIIFLFSYSFQIAVIYFTKNYYIYTFTLVISSIAINLSVNFVTNKLYPNLKIEGEIDTDLKKDIIEKVKGLIINKICITSRNSLDSIFVSMFLGLVSTAIYNNYYYILNSVVSLMAVVGIAIQAGVGNSIVTETKEKNYSDMNKINFIYMWISGWCTICLLCLYQPFTQLTFGKDMLFPFSLVILFTIYFYVLKMGDIRAVYSDAKGLWWENRYRALIEAFLNLVLNIALGKIFGVTGIVIATLISLFVCNFLWGSKIIFEHYFTNKSVKEYFGYHFLYAFITFIVCILTYSVCQLVPFHGIYEVLLKAVICLILPNILYILIYSFKPKFRGYFKWFFNIFILRVN